MIFFLTNFEGLIPMKMWLIDGKGMDVAKPIWLSGCPKKFIAVLKTYF